MRDGRMVSAAAIATLLAAGVLYRSWGVVLGAPLDFGVSPLDRREIQAFLAFAGLHA